MEDAARRWDQRYRREEMPRGAAALLVEEASLLPRGGKALDVAMGNGRNALYLASLGFQVTGIDISSVAVERCRQRARALGLSVTAIAADLERHPLPVAEYDLVVNFNYLQRSLVGPLVAALKPGGVLVFETFTTEQRRFGAERSADLRPYGPKDPEHVLRPGELRQLFPSLEPLFYREEVVPGEKGPKAIASL
ncbi:MAG: class I SAM-dependent methyltransferase, partial [Dehalococcoidia bacterium]